MLPPSFVSSHVVSCKRWSRYDEGWAENHRSANTHRGPATDEGWVQADRAIAIGCLTSTAQSKFSEAIERLPQDSLRRMGNTIAEFELI